MQPERFVAEVKGLEHVPEGGIRCEKCFVLRLSETAKLAQAHGFDYFTTSLTISPLKKCNIVERGRRGCGSRILSRSYCFFEF